MRAYCSLLTREVSCARDDLPDSDLDSDSAVCFHVLSVCETNKHAGFKQPVSLLESDLCSA